MFGRLLSRGKYFHDLAGTALCDTSHCFLYDIRKSACLVARSRVCVTAYAALCKVLIVPFHLLCQTVTGVGIRAACCQHVNAVANLGNLTEHNGSAATNQHICCVTCTRVSGNTGECITAAALHTDQQVA